MREFLKGLELEQETIDKIMAEVGKKINESTEDKETITTLKKEIKSLKADNENLKTTVEDNKKSLENLETLTNENKDLKAQAKMSGSNVKKEFSKFVTSEVQALVNDDVDFDKALETYKKDNPQYFGDVVVKKVQSSPSLQNGDQPQTTNDIMNNLLRGKN